MKVRIAALALLTAAGIASAALNAYRTGISLPQAVKLADGSVLPAGKYDVEIHFRGSGNAAELHFLRGGELKGKAPAEARGFPSVGPLDKGIQKGNAASGHDAFAKIGDIKGESTDSKHKDEIEAVKKPTPGAMREFSWGKAGFPEGRKGVVTKGPPGMLKLSFDSTNSAAGFSALLPYVEAKKR